MGILSNMHEIHHKNGTTQAYKIQSVKSHSTNLRGYILCIFNKQLIEM
jgi:hypothetical protein